MRQTATARRAESATTLIEALVATNLEGQVCAVTGQRIDVSGLAAHASVGDRLRIAARSGQAVTAEITGFRADQAQVMTFGDPAGLGPGSRVTLKVAVPRRGQDDRGQDDRGQDDRSRDDRGRDDRGRDDRGLAPALMVSDHWIGRILDPFGDPMDGRPPPVRGDVRTVIRAQPLPPTTRVRLGQRLDLGVRALDLFTTCRQGQRLGLFAGSGVGKSTLIAMLARNTDCDVVVLALVGERGREVREFVEDDLGADGLARSVVVVATSDQPPLMRREAAYAAMAIAEHFRDQGRSVLLLMDSVTRFCHALREIGLSSGEPPATRGYPPSVFAELPRLLERAGPGALIGGRAGHITGLFSVLVDGDDHNEPVTDAVRGILDGHVVLDRRIAEAGRFPAVNVLRSLSRSVPGCLAAEENALAIRARRLLAVQSDMEDIIRLGAYRPGTDPDVDEAVRCAPALKALLSQRKDERSTIAAAFDALRDALASGSGQTGAP